MNFNTESLVRENIKKLRPYSTARHEYKGNASLYLDANENAFGSPVNEISNRYPDPLQLKLKEKLEQIKSIPQQNIFLGNGSDEAIDLLIRIFCEPGKDNVIIFPPTYGMYRVCAEINNIAIKEVTLTEQFQPDMKKLNEVIDPFTKLIFICSPNNPSGNSINRNYIELILNSFNGLVVLDEAYINYATQKSFSTELKDFPNLVVLQTLSKSWGLAGLRLGMAFASDKIIKLMNKVKYPYNISSATQNLALQALSNQEWVNEHISITVKQREFVKSELMKLPIVQTIYSSDANFLLVKFKNAPGIYAELMKKGIIVRDRSQVILCKDCLRITIGTPEENSQLLKVLSNLKLIQ